MHRYFLVVLGEEASDFSSVQFLQRICSSLAEREVQLVEEIGFLPHGTPEAIIKSSLTKICVTADLVTLNKSRMLCLGTHALWTAPPGVCIDDLALQENAETRDILERLSQSLEHLSWAADVLRFERSGDLQSYLGALSTQGH